MNRLHSDSTFIKHISDMALNSNAVNHPYLNSMRMGNFPNIDMAFKDFAFQYGLYSKKFILCLSTVIKNISNDEHKQILLANLAEEQGDTHDIVLPPDVLASVVGQPHSNLYRRFQEAVGIDASYLETTLPCQTALLWSKQFLQLCEINECVGVGAIGIGTELIVSKIYSQILDGLKAHSDISMIQRVFFDLHSVCDENHAAQMQLIAASLARDRTSCDQIEYGVRTAINMRVVFWDKMLERAENFSASPSLYVEELSAIGH